MINASFDSPKSALHEPLARADNGEPDQRRLGLLVSSGFNPPPPGQAGRRLGAAIALSLQSEGPAQTETKGSRRGCTTYRRRQTRVGEICHEQRALAEWKLGRRLCSGKAVQHANGDRQDNHSKNLQIFSSQRAHMLFAHYRSREARGVG